MGLTRDTRLPLINFYTIMNYKQHNLISYLKHFQMKNTSMMIATITPITSPTVPIYSEVSVVGCIWLVATLEVELDGGVVVGSISVGSWQLAVSASPRLLPCMWWTVIAHAHMHQQGKRSSQELKHLH